MHKCMCAHVLCLAVFACRSAAHLDVSIVLVPLGACMSASVAVCCVRLSGSVCAVVSVGCWGLEASI